MYFTQILYKQIEFAKRKVNGILIHPFLPVIHKWLDEQRLLGLKDIYHATLQINTFITSPIYQYCKILFFKGTTKEYSIIIGLPAYLNKLPQS